MWEDETDESENLIQNTIEDVILEDGGEIYNALIDLLQQKVAMKDYVTKNALHQDSLYIHIHKKELVKRYKSDEFDEKQLQRIFSQRFPNKQLTIDKNVSISANDRYRATGKQAATYFLLALPFGIPGFIYLHKISQYHRFIISNAPHVI